MSMSRSWVFVIFLASFQAVSSQPKKKIFMGALALSYNGDEQGFQAAMEYATETVNNRSDILKDYELVVRYAETLGSPIYTVLGVFNFLRWPKNESMQILIGPAWSKNAGPAALACGAYRVLQISYGATSVELQKDQYYGKLFSNVPSTTSFNFARIAVIKHFGWKRVAILQEYDEQLYSSAISDFHVLLNYFARDISIITSEGYKKDSQDAHPKAELERLQKVDARIIIGEFSIYRAAEIFCEAYRLGMYGPKYVWFLSATSTGAWIFSPETFKMQHKMLRCSYEEIVTAAEGFIVIANVDIRQDNTTTVSGLNASTYLTELRKRNGRALARTSYAFDSIWAAALMLNETSNETRPENLVLGSDKFSNEYEKLLKEQEFEGLSGPHKFSNRQRMGTVVISQMRVKNNTPELVQIGTHDAATDELTFNEEEVKKMWKDDKIPLDETRKERKVLNYSLLQLIFIGVFAILGLIYSLGLLYFNISKRNHKVVRMSSPMINNVVILGCFFCYVFVFLLGIDSRFVSDHVFRILCNVRLYVLAIAFSMAFGALFSKTWRVHKIFTAQRAIKKKMMRDFHLILFVLALVLIDVVFITVWIFYDPLKPEDIVFDDLIEQSNDLITIPVLKICECSHRTKLLGALYGYKGILLLFGVFLAWETRNVTIPALNDSKYIGMSVYNVVILSSIGATVSMVLKKTQYYELLHVLVSVVVLLSTTVTLTMVFLPKVYECYTTPPEPKERVRTMETLSMSVRSTTTTDDVYEAYIKPKDVKHKWIQTEDFDQVPKVTMYADVQQGINNGYRVDKEEQVLEDKLQKYQEYKVGSLDQLGFQEDKDWY